MQFVNFCSCVVIAELKSDFRLGGVYSVTHELLRTRLAVYDYMQ